MGVDPSKAAGAVASILGTVAGFVVTAVVLLITILTTSAKEFLPRPQVLEYSAGLLTLSLLGCLLGAFAFAALSGEEKPTTNHQAAGVWSGAGAAVSIVSGIAAFEVLSYQYLPGSKTLFAIVCAVAGAVITGLISLALVNARREAEPEPTPPVQRRSNLELWLSGWPFGFVLIFLGLLYFFVRSSQGTPSGGGIEAILFTGIGLVCVAPAFASVRALRRAPDELSLGQWEMRIAQVLAGGYLGVIVALLP